MLIGYIGTDHSRAPLTLRERLALSDEWLDALLDALAAEPMLAEAAVLSTCNRIEVYVAAPDIDAALDSAAAHLLRVAGVRPDAVAGLLRRQVAGAAARHLCAVAAGLESQVVGETQILTQVREAFARAAARDAAGPELQELARTAVSCGKRVRAQTTLGAADTSVSAVAVERAQQRLGDLRGRAAVLIGAGRINAVSARLLRDAEIGSLVVASRTYAAAARLAAACGGIAGTLEELPGLLAVADVAIAAARAPEPLVAPAILRPRPAERPLLLLDIAVPRNIDPAVAALPHVEVIDLDRLKASSDGSVAPPDGVPDAWAIVDACVEQYRIAARTRRAVPLIARLRAHVDRQKEAEVARTLAALDHLAPEDRAAVALLAHRLVNRMFHQLATRLKAAATLPDGDAYLAALAFLFDATGMQDATGTGTDDRAGAAPAAALRGGASGRRQGLLGGLERGVEDGIVVRQGHERGLEL